MVLLENENLHADCRLKAVAGTTSTCLAPSCANHWHLPYETCSVLHACSLSSYKHAAKHHKTYCIQFACQQVLDRMSGIQSSDETLSCYFLTGAKLLLPGNVWSHYQMRPTYTPPRSRCCPRVSNKAISNAQKRV